MVFILGDFNGKKKLMAHENPINGEFLMAHENVLTTLMIMNLITFP